jgi:predicted DNA-binding transcriptional regulator YafY
MARKRSPRVSPSLKAVTDERARRLARLLQLLGAGPQTRAALTRQLRLDVRGFYRDLELLRTAGIAVTLQDRRYTLEEPVAQAIDRLPFPDPHLTLGEARQIAKGRTAAHRKLQAQVRAILPAAKR